MEIVQEVIMGVRADMKTFQEEGVTLEKQRQMLLAGMEEKLKVTESETHVQKEKCSAAVKVLDQLKSGMRRKNLKDHCPIHNCNNTVYCYIVIWLVSWSFRC